MRPLLLIGAGGFGRETADAVRAANAVEPRWKLVGFLDDSPALQGSEVGGLAVLGKSVDVDAFPDAAFVVCAGSPRNYFARKRIVTRLGLAPSRYATIIHPQASVPGCARVGPGSVLLASAVVTSDAAIGAHVAVMPGVVITHDDQVGDFATLASGVRLGGGARVGEGAYVGSGALIREGVSVGGWSLVGMGAVVLTDVPPAEVWVGMPARRLRSVTVPGDVSV
jgi:sugar O-acyltransferase (sialic acid O-acetyltransferase NeuD family)